MSDKMIVIVVPRDEKDQGQVTILDSRDEARELVGRLLASDVGRDQITVLSGRELSFNVSYRPVVSFDEELESASSRPAYASTHNPWEERSSSSQDSQSQWGSEHNP